jgi:hypothetical protein
MAVRVLRTSPDGPPVPGYPDMKGTFEVTFEGAVLSLGERNWHDDSDFFATVWDEATGTVHTVDYATTRGWTYANGASVDATPEVREKAAAFYAARDLESRIAKANAAARTPARGLTVKVVKGRKVPKGTTGTVIWVGEGKYFGPTPRYKSSAWSTAGALRVGVKDAEGTVHWTAASNVEVLDPAEPNIEELTRLANWTGREYAGLSRVAA